MFPWPDTLSWLGVRVMPHIRPPVSLLSQLANPDHIQVRHARDTVTMPALHHEHPSRFKD